MQSKTLGLNIKIQKRSFGLLIKEFSKCKKPNAHVGFFSIKRLI